jgi:hypothetical protein
MADLVMIATMVGFVLLCIGYVHWCDRIIAADQADAPGDDLTDRDPATTHEQVAA